MEKSEGVSVWAGQNYVTELPAVRVEEITPGVGRMVCPECGGNQERYRSFFPPELGVTHCIDCKGTGYVYVSI